MSSAAPPASRLRRFANNAALPGLCALAAVLSFFYQQFILRGGPRIIDATSYFLQARGFAAGQTCLQVPGGWENFQGRFLVPCAKGGQAVLFPPGYAAAWAPFHWLGLPWLMGPAVAAALTWGTYRLAERLTGSASVALLAATLSTLSATLRYHTADGMSHGWNALLAVVTYLAVVRGTDRGAAAGGLVGGWLVATRPVTAAALLLPTLLSWRRRTWRQAALFIAGLLPGTLAFLSHQLTITGKLTTSVQQAYYAVADGPPGCFRYGFGPGIGCLFEHGDFVQRVLPHGFDAMAALHVTANRLNFLLRDVANAWPLGVLALVALFLPRLNWNEAWARWSVPALILAYVPFYFPGTYAGGGARFYVEVLPLLHVALASVLVRWKVGWTAAPAALLALAFLNRPDLLQLRDREGGWPMWTTPPAGARLLFVDTDHSFNLGFDPKWKTGGPVVARWHADRGNWELWNALHRPEAWRLRYDLQGSSPPRWEPVHLEATPPSSWSAAALWPPLAAKDGWAAPRYFWSPDCAGLGLGLYGVSERTDPQVQLLVPRGLTAGPRTLLLRGFAAEGQEGSATVQWGEVTRTVRWTGAAPTCWELTLPLPTTPPSSWALSLHGAAPILYELSQSPTLSVGQAPPSSGD